ncbi:NADH-quinone oxidoreductase subunit L [Sphingobacteriales bacterium UPWRP_1]|nr:NADH-quinone oxidoreductase subunit L [Sphingobacteriales bacterium TSM_CSS]PSJ74741.1 NADH-quinone oxidoreductase subunit L [Sphingobacteriales bacterium UPWRP_1]
MNLTFAQIALAALPFLPLAGFAVNGLWGRRFKETTIGIVGCGSILLSFLLSVFLFMANLSGSFATVQVRLFDWIPVANGSIGFSLMADPLSLIMLLVITGVGLLIHLYSVGYMHGDAGFARFFAYLNLFIFFMLLLVLADNFLLLFAGWEGVGLCSFLLIGFWFTNESYNAAAKKAFVMNRIGDLGFLLGMFLIVFTYGSLNFDQVFTAAATAGGANNATIIAITLLLFWGACGKSAQIPLYTWLPDAMAGPTPVSALIHAATMVTAGIYLVARCHVLFSLAPFTLSVVLAVGVATALLAATIALFQTDIKKVLAYSTVSQLGYMFAALGTGAYVAGLFHVVTHAFFKALLFLGAGAVIHALHHEQDLRNMGGLRTELPFVYRIFLVGTLAISGIPVFSGFFSKDEILMNVFQHHTVAWGLLFIGALLTTFYMFRLLALAFWGEKRGHHANYVPMNTTMKLPLAVLAFLSFAGGFAGLPEFTGLNWLHHYLSPVFSDVTLHNEPHLSIGVELGLMAFTVLAIAGVIWFYASRFKHLQTRELNQLNGELPWYKKLPANKYYVDEWYNRLLVQPINRLSDFLYRVADTLIIDGLVNRIGGMVLSAGNRARKLQSGDIGIYLYVMLAGASGLFLLYVLLGS